MMISFYKLPPAAYALCGSYAIMLMTAASYVLVNTFTMHLRWAYRMISFALAVFCFFFLIGVADVKTNEFSRSLFLAKAMGSLPFAVVIILLLVLNAAVAVLYTYLRRKRKKILTPNSVKESLDALPDGVCFSTKDGMPIIVNMQMNQICGQLFDCGIMNAEKFVDDLKNGEFGGMAKRIRIQPNIAAETSDGKVWEFRSNRLTIGNSEVTELVAYDMTEQYKLNRELKDRNKRMDAIGERLRRFSREVARVTRDKEILNAIIRVHDDLGRALLMLRAYLIQPHKERDRKSLLLLWRYNTEVMKHEKEPNRTGDSWDLLIRLAQNIGVEIVHSGGMPENERYKTVFMAALRECLTNTVKHAKGTRMDILITETDTAVSAEITNNGKPPESKIREVGGLKNLRTIIENAGGSMTIQSVPSFVLRAELPKGEKEDWPKQRL